MQFFRGVPGDALQERINTWLAATGARPQLTNTLWDEVAEGAEGRGVIVTVWYEEAEKPPSK